MERKILKKWSDPSFAYSFASPLRLYTGLKKLPEFSQISLKDVQHAVEKEPYVYQPKTWTNHYETRHLDFGPPKMDPETQTFSNNPITGQGIVFQGDLFELPVEKSPSSNKTFAHFLLLVDAWDNYIYVKEMSTKSSKETLEAIKEIINENKLFKFALLTTDAGKEFKGMLKMPEWKELHIKHFVLTKSEHKAFLAEGSGRKVKAILYKFMRFYHTQNWPIILQKVVFNINHSVTKKLGDAVSPAEVNSPIYDDYVRELHSLVAKEQPPSNKRYPNKTEKSFKIGDYCYLEFQKDVFSKGYHLKRGQLYRIYKIDNLQSPYKFYLEDLNKKELPRFYYAHQLKKFYGDLKKHSFPIDHIVKTRTDKQGQKWHKIRYVYLTMWATLIQL